MESRVRLFGHSVHQMLIVFPLGMLGAAVAFDVLYLIRGTSEWALIAYRLIAGGLIMSAITAPFGTIDWLGIPQGTRAKRVGAYHGVLMVAVVLMFAASWWLRRSYPVVPSMSAQVLSIAALFVAAVGAWFGGELVSRLGIGVSPTANPDAPSSLSHRV